MGIKHYYQKTPVRMRKLGDTILIGCTSLSAMMMGAPMSDHAKTWTIFALNVAGVVGKMLTNFFKEDDEVKSP
jgi:DNA-binding transcriptional regulator LsrR (DeoR family)